MITKYRLYEIMAKARVRIARGTAQFLLGSLAGNMPKKSVRSLEEVAHLPEIKRHLAKIIQVDDPQISYYNFPENYGSEFRRAKAFDKRNVFVLTDVCVSVDSGLVWLPEGLVLVESVGSLVRLLSWGRILHEPLLRPTPCGIKEPVLVCPDTGYYHWLFERVPTVLRALAESPNLKILVPDRCKRYVVDALRLILGEDLFKDAIVFARGPMRVSRLVMPQIGESAGFVHPSDTKILQNRLRPQFTSETDTYEKKLIYVSRVRTRGRRLTDEATLENALQKIGFKVVYAEELSFPEQIKLFASAKFIVGPHGAGLSNIVWANLPCRILEIFPSTCFNDCYARLASSLGFTYDYTVCYPDNASEGFIDVSTIIEIIQR